MRKDFSEIQKECEQIHLDIYELKSMIRKMDNYICDARYEIQMLRQDLFKYEKKEIIIDNKEFNKLLDFFKKTLQG